MGDASTPKGAVTVLPPEDAGEEQAALVPLRYRHDGWTAGAQRGFLKALGETGCVRDACRMVKRSSTSLYKLRARSAEFAAECDRALKMAGTVLDHTAFERAVIGIEEPVWHHGKVKGMRRRYSDSLLRLLILRGDMRAGAGKRPEELELAAREAAKAAGGYFERRSSEAETDAAIMKQLAALDKRYKANPEREAQVYAERRRQLGKAP